MILGAAEAADDDTVPWLPAELTLLDRAINSGTPVLGICFGAQLLTRALGGTVHRAARPERGFVALDSADHDLLPAGTWGEFHYDVFTLPPGATPLTRNDVGLQAFTHGPHLAVQFHPEITPEVFASWRAHWGPETDARVAAEIDLAELAAELDERASTCAKACRGSSRTSIATLSQSAARASEVQVQRGHYVDCRSVLSPPDSRWTHCWRAG